MVNETAPREPLDEEALELPDIEFESPGLFSVHNPEPVAAINQSREPAPFVLGEHIPLEHFNTPDQVRAHALALLQQARRSLCIYSQDLEPWLYHHSSVQQACTEFLLANPRNRLRVLVKDLNASIKDGNRLITLSRRLSSNLLIRKLNPDYPIEDSSYLLADDRGVLLRPEADQFSGYASYQDAGRVRLRQAHFNQAWETSITDPDLRSFLL
ncbi:histone acetyltransferase HPA2 [Pseudomonas sp. M30-35]|uniref:DUF7931 domain-containing protein n=1 Tax=Pseudomonas sp. M30-35 TaxID=1981174 RepID=UPI000B3C16DD|nr:histone acetyltransferase HPA2 [Pseudomonas sp. M30-35]ARU88404.1 histone acetyltransferase HPA2 [Pseudomonas sp. M30-35]